MQLDRFTTKSRAALEAASALAAARNHTEATPEHLLAVLLEQEDGIVVPVLRKLGARPDPPGPAQPGPPPRGHPPGLGRRPRPAPDHPGRRQRADREPRARRGP